MKFYYYLGSIIHFCSNSNSYRNVYTKRRFQCPGCGIKVPWILALGEPINNIKSHLMYLGPKFNASKDLPLGAKEVEL